MRGNNHLHHFFLLSSQRFPTSEYYVIYFCNNNIMYDRTLVCILMYSIDEKGVLCYAYPLNTIWIRIFDFFQGYPLGLM